MEVTSATDFLGKIVTLQIDRPLGSKHPCHGFVYPINYGFVPYTLSPDGAETDAYVLGVSEPLTEFTGLCIAVIHRTNDDDDKLIVVPIDRSFTDKEIEAATHFQEQFFQSIILLKFSAHPDLLSYASTASGLPAGSSKCRPAASLLQSSTQGRNNYGIGP